MTSFACFKNARWYNCLDVRVGFWLVALEHVTVRNRAQRDRNRYSCSNSREIERDDRTRLRNAHADTYQQNKFSYPLLFVDVPPELQIVDCQRDRSFSSAQRNHFFFWFFLSHHFPPLSSTTEWHLRAGKTILRCTRPPSLVMSSGWQHCLSSTLNSSTSRTGQG